MGTTTMNVRVDEALRARFIETAKQQDRTAAQLIRGFMRDVVTQHAVPDPAAALRPPISEEERERRMKGYEFAKANVGLEGHELSAEYEEIAMKFINGDIEWDEFRTKSVAA
jgi:hypothetical protein